MITQILQLFKEKAFGGDDEAETELAAMNCLSIYLMYPLTDEEVSEDMEYANVVKN